MAQDYKVITYADSSELQHLMFSPLGSGRRTYYENKMKGDPSALYLTDEELIGVLLEDPKTLMWGAGIMAAGDKRIKQLNILDKMTTPGAYAYPKVSCTYYVHVILYFRPPPALNHSIWLVINSLGDWRNSSHQWRTSEQ